MYFRPELINGRTIRKPDPNNIRMILTTSMDLYKECRKVAKQRDRGRPCRKNIYEHIKKYGENLHVIGGYDLMLSVCETLHTYSMLERDMPLTIGPIMNELWDGIGDWRA